MKITLTGYMGSGKSTIAKHLAILEKLEFIDLDTQIENKTGYTITETIFNKGEVYFRQLERETLQEVLKGNNFVLSTGGGTPCYYDNIDLINKHSISIFLHYGVNELYTRLEGNQSERPLIAHLEGPLLKEYIAKHLFERLPYYDKSIFTIKASAKTKEDILNQIQHLIHE